MAVLALYDQMINLKKGLIGRLTTLHLMAHLSFFLKNRFCEIVIGSREWNPNQTLFRSTDCFFGSLTKTHPLTYFKNLS